VSCADEALAYIRAEPEGVGIGAPMWWSSGESSDRKADQWVRQPYKIPSGTVQTGNSLRGAALVQAAMFVDCLRRRYPAVRVTESHPKAVLKATGGWAKFSQRYCCGIDIKNEHLRDAAIGAVAAREGFSGNWPRDLALTRHPSEQDPSTHWLAPMHYFWPE
jgi:hypothetical protein